MTELTDQDRILVHLFRDGYHRNVVAVARALRMEQSTVRNHLEWLAKADLARLNVTQGHLYWGITDEGRRFVTARGLAQDAGQAATL